jgi:CDP-2,3-bis-(O-geranylgeranyl)-sn-glycerol synthase
MRGFLIFQMLALSTAANSTPLFVTSLLRKRKAVPVDRGGRLKDGQPLFGASKTWRGIASAVIASSLVAPLIGLPIPLGALAGTGAMLGDLCSSFIKRRLGLAAGDMALGLDQIPESLFPSLLLRLFLPLAWIDIAIVMVIFLAGELVLSQLLFCLHIRDRPY